MSRESVVSAIERGDLSELQHVLEESEWDIGSESLDSEGQTALHIACANGHLDIVQYLINRKGCSVTVEDVYGHTPLMISLINKHWKMANFLLQFAPDSSTNDLEGKFTSYNLSIVMELAKEALIASCKEGFFGLVQYLIKSGWHTLDDKEIILLARCFDNLHIVKYLLTHCQCTMPDDMSEVHIACIQGDVEMVKMVLDSNGPSILGTADDFGTAPIHYATLEPNLLRMIVQYDKGMLLNITDSMGNTPLHHSIKYECIESVNILVEAPGCDVNIANLKEKTPLIVACKYSNSNVVQILAASKRCDINTSDSEGQTALHIACDNGHLDIVQYLVNRRGCSVTVKDVSGHSPPMLSFINEHWKVVNYLLQIAPDSVINELERILPFYNMSIVAKEAFVTSCKEGYFELVICLIKNGWHIADHEEIFQLARYMDNLHIVKYLLTHCQCTIPDGMSEVHIACIQGDVEKVKVALDSNGPSILGTLDPYDTTPIHYSTLEPNLLRMIVQYAGEMLLNIANGKGNTPLHHSIKYECIESVTILVGAPGCDVNIANLKGETPLIAACKYSNSAVVQILAASERCDINTSDSKGQTALHIACANGHLDIVRFLVNKKECSMAVKDVSGHSSPMLSFINEHWKVVNYLLQIAPDSVINELERILTSYNMSIVMELAKEAITTSCKEGYFELVIYLIKSGWHTVDHKEIIKLARHMDNLHIVKYLLTHCQCTMPDDMSEVHIACMQGDAKKVKTALDSNGPSILGTADDFGIAPIYYATLEPNLLRMIVQYAGEMLLNITDSMGNTPLHHSIKYECIESVNILVGAPGCDVNIADLKGETPLIAACKYSNSAIVQILVASDRCDLNTCDGEGNTPLHVTLSNKSIDQMKNVQCLLQREKCDPNVINKSGCTPLQIVCHRGDIPLLKLLAADKRCDLNIEDGNGDTALHIGAKNVEVVKCLLESGRSRCDIYNKKGLTPFHKAIVNGVMASVEVMMKNGVNILQTSNDKFENAPIHIACEYSRLGILRVLLGCTNCDPNQQNAVGDTALHIVCRMRTGSELQFLEVLTSTPGINPNVQCLLQSDKCDPNVINKSGCTPLHIVCHQGNVPLLEALVADKRCDLNIEDGNGDTALHIGVENVEVVKCLLESGRSRCDIYNEEGLTPFHKAIVNGVMASVEIMMKNGVNILQTSNDIYQNAPIHIACIHSRLDILKVLLSCECCDPNQQNSKGDTALHIVCRMRTGSELQFLDVLTSTPGITPTLLNLDGNAPIHTACMNSRLESLKVLLSCKSCDPNQQNSWGDTALHILCRMRTGNEPQLLEVLTSTPGINPILLNVDGNAPIHTACMNSRLESLKVLLSCRSCDPNQQNSKGDTALHIVCRMRTGNEPQLLEVLTSTPGINPILLNHDGNAAIHTACMHFRLKSLKVLLSCKNCDPNQQNSKGDTALHIVCRMRTGRELQFLEVLTSTPGINPTLVNHEGIAPCDVVDNDGNTLLHIACAEGNTKIVELLVRNRANILTLNHEGNVPIHTACMNSRLESLKVLLSCKSCDPNQQNSKGDTALHIVCRMRTGRELQFLEVLTSTPGINPILLNHDGNAAIHTACMHFRLKSLKVLLSCKNCDPNQQNSKGDTALHIVCRMRTGRELQFLEMLTSTPGINPTLVNHEGIAPCDVVDNDGNTLLHIACAEGNTKIVELLVRNRANILTLNHEGNVPIHTACMNSRLESLKVLLSCKSCDPNQQNSKGDTALHIVCRMRTGRELQFLEVLTSTPGINPILLNHDGNAAIHTACMHFRLKSLKVLLSCKNCDPNQQNSKGDTALHIVCRMRTGRELQFLEVLTSTPGSNPTLVNHEGIAPCDVVDNDGNTLLHIACAEGNTKIVELLVRNRANVLTLNHEGNVPIHTACMNSRLESLKVLLSCKSCDPNQQNSKGDTALHIVCRMRTGRELQFLEVLTSTPGINPTLVNHEGIAPCDVVDNDGNTLLHIACAEGNTKIVELLVRNRANVLTLNHEGNVPIHTACMNSRLESLKVLLSCKSCDPNQQNSKGDTALHIVCRMRTGRELQFLELLTSTPGINPTLVNHAGITPCDVIGIDGNTLLHIACAEGNTAIIELLVRNRANVLILNHEGNAAIHTACMNSRLESLKVLLSCESCNHNQQNSKGDTALHIVCRMRTGRELLFLKVLTSTPGINPTLVNLEGNAPIHTACMNSRLNLLKVVLSCESCDPNQQNSKGDTALHIVCRMRTGRELQFLEVLTSTPGINSTLVNHEFIRAFEVVDSGGNSLFHIACAEGNISLVELLVKNGADILKPNSHGDAPIHTACQHSRLDILKILLESRDCDPNQQNGSGDTPLHIVCRMSRSSKLPFLKLLLSTPGINPEIANHEGCTPIEVAGTNYFAIDAIEKFLEHKRASIQAYLKIFVVGNSGNGKSTLIKAVTTEASQLLKYSPLSKMKYINPSDVPPHTAGIVPIPFNSKHFGNAVLYDFAGQHEYYSSHAAVMENLILPSSPLFLLLIDISKSKEVIREELVYWWHFINNQSQKAAAPPHVILAGSHKDMVKSRDRKELEIIISNWIKAIPVCFEFVGYFSLDCRKLVSQGLSALLTQLNTTCQVVRQFVDVNLHCHILNALLRAPEFQDLVYCRTSDIMSRIQSDNALLPQTFSLLIPLLASLNDRGHILLLQNHTDESKSWVILKPDVLLTEVNGSVFAPKYFKEHSEFAMSTGVVTLSKLKEKFIEYNHEVIVEYLTHLEFCFRIKDQHTLDMITNNEVHDSAAAEEYYFFPSLVRVENPTNVCQPHQSIGYECGWLYKCSKETEQLTTRFLHVLILRLAFACDPPDDPTETESVVLLRSCSVWKHGIAWWTNDGIEVIVEVGLQCRWVVVMLRCPDDKKVECAELRSKVIHTVLKAKTDFCPVITIRECLIAPSSLKYPFEGRELTLYSMREVARATIEGKDYARDTEGKNPITIPQLLPFEPYYNMGDLVSKFFSGNTSVAVRPEELTQIAVKCHKKLAELNTAFKPDVVYFEKECVKADCTEVERCVALFYILQRRGHFKTWRDFQHEFSRFSIFCEQNPLVRMMSKHLISAHSKIIYLSYYM